MVQTQKKLKKRHVFLICLILVLSALVAFEQVRNNDFVSYDDNQYVTENPHVKGGINTESVVWAFTASHASNWHPLTWLSHMLDCQLFGLKAGAHHLVNLLFHIVNTLLLFAVFKRMTGAVWCSGFVAAAFALHPLHVESVAWIAERKDVLSAFFWFLTMWAYIRYAERPCIRRYLLVFLFLALGLMSKPMLVTLPFVLLLVDYWPLERLSKRAVLEKIPLLVLVAALSLITVLIEVVIPQEVVGLKLRVANAFISYAGYIGKTIWPARLAILYPHPLNRVELWQPIVCFLILTGVTAAVCSARKRYLTVGWLWFVGTLVPVIGLVQIGVQSMADRYTYLPLVGIFIMVAWGAAELSVKLRYRKIVLAVLAGIVLAGMLICTRIQVRHWRNSFTLFEHALEVTENNYTIHYNLGYVLQSEGRLDEAASHYRQTLQIMPAYVKAHNSLGIMFGMQGQFDTAMTHFNQALKTEPEDPEAHYNMGLMLRAHGKLDEAVKHFSIALGGKPDDVDIHLNLAIVFKLQGRLDKAISHFYRVLAAEPNRAEIHHHLAVTLTETKQIEKSLEHFGEAIRLKPDWVEPMNAMAWVLATRPEKGGADEAVVLAERTAQLTKYQNASVLDTLAATYAAAGQFEKAVRTAQTAIDLSSKAQADELVSDISKRLELYKQSKAYREPAQR